MAIHFIFAVKELITLIVLCLCATIASAQEIDHKNWLIERMDLHKPLGDHSALSIENPFGDVRIRTSNDDIVSVFAVIQRHVKDTVRPEIIISSEQKTLNVRVKYPPVSEPGVALTDPIYKHRRIDVSVLAPKTVSMQLKTLHGLAESKGHKGSLNVQTTTGRINIVTSGSLTAHSQSGNIQASFRNRIWKESSKITSATGNIHVILMEHPDIKVKISTAGNITTDYSVDITSFSGTTYKEATAKIGKASNLLQLESQRGAITINRLFDMITTKPQADNSR